MNPVELVRSHARFRQRYVLTNLAQQQTSRFKHDPDGHAPKQCTAHGDGCRRLLPLNQAGGLSPSR
jgi:hypothetical protein